MAGKNNHIRRWNRGAYFSGGGHCQCHTGTGSKMEILFVGAKGKMEMEKIPKAGYKIEGLDIAGYNRSSLIKNILFTGKVGSQFFPGTRHLQKVQT